MKRPENIRNISVIAHVDHGKTTLSDSLVSRAGIIAEKNSGGVRYMSTTKIEQDRGITIKSSSISLHFELTDKEMLPNGSSDSGEFLINLIDSPGHVDFSSEVTAALRVTDGALVVVDCVEGACVQTETVLRQACAEQIRPVLFINKIDRFLVELQKDSESCYQSFVRVINQVNEAIGTFSTADFDANDSETDTAMYLSPENGKVAFGSGYLGFGFNLGTWAKIYSQKFGINRQKLVKRLWGENYYCPDSKVWQTESTSKATGKQLPRTFCKFILDPIFQIYHQVMADDFEKLSQMMKGLGVQLDKEDQDLKEKQLFKSVMKKLLPVADCILEMVVLQLPSPLTAQRYRIDTLYDGPMDDECANAIRDCDPNGPLMMYVSKLVPTSEAGHFYAFGRVFSGTVKSNQKVSILTSDSTGKVIRGSIQRPVLMMGRKTENIEECPCGNIIGLVGVDQFILKSATITTSDLGSPIRGMKLYVSPVVRMAVQPKDTRQLPKLVEGLKRLSKADPSVVCTTEESGELIIAGVGELHLEICLNELITTHAGIDVVASQPIVSFRESVLSTSSMMCISKSPNNLNRLYANAEPLSNELSNAIEQNLLPQEAKELSKYLSDNFDWQSEDAKNIWSFGPEISGANTLVNMTKGVQNLGEIKDSIVQSFQWSTREGVLCSEELRGVRFNIHDAKLHSDSVHRSGMSQIIPATRRVLYASQLTATPTLLEPIYLVSISVTHDAVAGVYLVLNKRKGSIISEERKVGSPLVTIVAHLPVLQSFGFTGELRANTSGKAFPQCTFDHWKSLGSLESKQVNDLVLETRKRKGLAVEIPHISKFYDKIN
ncbi:elongation factor 2 [Tieghemostelium lacteum]|uniref:Elongation factor 2 n=1 Tax=Tieghemostelium lacteum TaxID=361077 RepID=A0A151ZSF2_TIELA|nr:elongation factor 2 [Tieghemostelium lacteum]|eukprot:KYQ96868.1 elongation factor 2 [Tieghemostelium lacteum]